jgi:polyhydroxybutyrate depolymerase
MRFVCLITALLLGCGTAASGAECEIGIPGSARTIAIGDTGRALLVHVPKGFDGSRPAPLVLLLHGSGGTGRQMLANSGLAETADRHGFILAAPDGGIPVEKGFVWNIPGVPTVAGTIPGPGDADDVAYIGTVIDTLADKACVDRARVYSTGLSGGGRMTSWLGCVASDRFAAIAPVVGLRAGNPLAKDPARPDPDTCKPALPVPVIAFAGDKDGTNPIAGGGAGYWQYSMHAAEQRWATINRCTAAPETRWVSDAVYEERYAGCAGEAG